ncbi:MAG: ATP-binding cassette domain-containing protein, partial [Bacteroidia bacterium]|nr:ATP-binding cassette domain-containing protein [Bacteroidia bacterium]
MNIQLVDTIVHLFAQLSKLEGVTEAEIRVVDTFLKQQLPELTAAEYLAKFNIYVRVEIEPLSELCLRLNKELTLKQKYFICLMLAELVIADGNITPKEQKGFETIVQSLNLPLEEIKPILDFVSVKDPLTFQHKNCLFLSGVPFLEGRPLLHIPYFDGIILVLRIPPPNLFIFRYFGEKVVTLNGNEIIPKQVYVMPMGSVLRSSRITPVYYSDIVAKFLRKELPYRIVFEAKSVTYVFPEGNIGLHDLSIQEESGRLVALMGASGAGKSTLLNVLNGNLKPSTGEILINGINIHQHPKSIEGLIGYVSQDDLLMEELTVFENLYYNAKLCFGNLSENEILSKIEKSLESLGLAEIQHLKVGSPLNKKISGGQRKR